MKIEQVEVLVLAAQEGKRDALELLYRHFFTPMKRYALIRVHQTTTAEDLVQNVWLKVGRRLQLMQDVRVFRSWLYKALRWEIIDWARQQRNANFEELNESSLFTEDLRPEVLDVAPLLAGLKPNEREVIELFYLSELSVNETALVLSIAPGTVKSRLHSAREELRHRYLNEGNKP
jgi:RNA polymerase sigma-70 factor (ECF subfamily)